MFPIMGSISPFGSRANIHTTASSEKHSYLIENPRPRGEVKERAEHFWFLNYLPLSVSDELNWQKNKLFERDGFPKS